MAKRRARRAWRRKGTGSADAGDGGNGGGGAILVLCDDVGRTDRRRQDPGFIMSVLLGTEPRRRDEERLLLVAVLVARPMCRVVMWCGGQSEGGTAIWNSRSRRAVVGLR